MSNADVYKEEDPDTRGAPCETWTARLRLFVHESAMHSDASVAKPGLSLEESLRLDTVFWINVHVSCALADQCTSSNVAFRI